MDDKGDRRKRTEAFWRRWQPSRVKPAKKILNFFQTNKSPLLTSVLLLSAIVLLFGIFSLFQPPAFNTTPAGETAIDYSTLLSHVQSGNVKAVALRGQEVFALLVEAPGEKHAQTTQPVQQGKGDADYIAWTRYVRASDTGTMSSQAGAPAFDPARAVYTRIPANDTTLMPLLLSKHVQVTTLPVSQNGNWLALLWRFLPFLFLGVLLLVFFSARNSSRSARSLDDRITQMGKSRVRRFERIKEANSVRSGPEMQKSAAQPGTGHRPFSPTGRAARPSTSRISTEPPVTFADVAGIDEVRVELEEIVEFLRNPERYDRLGARIPRGALLIGPPGTGKTLLAKAVAGEAGVPFFSMSASEFVEMFVGVGASRVRDLFNQARQASPCVVFIDELDAVGRKRSLRVNSNDERDQTLNQLLVELDGFDPRKAVVVLAATNRVDILDKALLRPGRFDRRITVSLPDRAGREAILRVHTRKVPLHDDVSLERLSRMTPGMSGADLANLVNEAALLAARKDLEHVTHDCFEQALARIQLGALRPLVMSEKERRIIAYHEGGHALVAYHLPEADTVNRVTILPRGQSLGVTQFTAEEDRYNYSRETLMTRIAVGLGGRVAEELTFGPERVTTGAENDLQVVTDLARRMVTRWGMSEQVGVVFADHQAEEAYALSLRRIDADDLPAQARSLVYNADGQLCLNGDVPARRLLFSQTAPAPRSRSSVPLSVLIDAEVQRILNEGREMARSILTRHYDQLARLAAALLEHEQLDRAQFEALLS
ncbi:MAG: ATP-dependent zinc metalloprotease FtsH [Ktedonobacteraceae bacterium]|nr:ATP-dependent zinc metalloprotease FtsH [Ktedonobacteraceae bacterium]